MQVDPPIAKQTEHEQVAQNVFDLVERLTGFPAERMRKDPHVRLNTSIDGDDAVELMEAFAKEFGVNMEGFAYERYFGSEGIRDPITTIVGWLRQMWRPARQPLTAAALVEAAVSKRWIGTSE